MLISYVGLWSSWKQGKEIGSVWAWKEIRTAVNDVREVSRGKKHCWGSSLEGRQRRV